MSREYTHLKALEKEILEMLANGKTYKEVAEYFKLKDKYVIKEFVKRQRRNQRKLEAGILPVKAGRPRKDIELTDENKLEYYKRQLQLREYDNQRLKMENELLRDFLHLAGRK